MSEAPTELPDCVVLKVFSHLKFGELVAVSAVCRQWFFVSRDEFLWKDLFYRHFGINRSVPRMPGVSSWLLEFRRLTDAVPCVEVAVLKEHKDQVLHVAFSHNGFMFASCSKDCTIKVWSNDVEVSVLYSESMRQYTWKHTQFSQFNEDDSLLLVSGVHFGPHNASSGEIAVFNLDDFTLLSRVRNKPYTVFGCWLNETHLISGTVHWVGNLTSCSVLWLNKAFQDIESETFNVVRKLFRFQNLNTSTVRAVMVADPGRRVRADCSTDDDPELQSVWLPGCHPLMETDPSHTPDSEGAEDEADEAARPERDAWGAGCRDDAALEAMVAHLVMGDQRVHRAADATHRSDSPATAAAAASTSASAPASLPPTSASSSTQPSSQSSSDATSDADESCPQKYLIFVKGGLTYTPHKIGIKRIAADQMSCDCPDETGHEEFLDFIDHLIDVRGHVVGMGLSPDHRLLYVSCRAWPEGCIISDPLNPPPIAREMELRVYELGTARELKRTPRAQRAYTSTDECSFFHLHVSRHFVASGSEDHNGYIWDRHYSVRLAHLPHDDCVSSVALSPVEQEMAVTASADHTLKVWRSARVVRIMTQTRKPRRTTFSWLKS